MAQAHVLKRFCQKTKWNLHYAALAVVWGGVGAVIVRVSASVMIAFVPANASVVCPPVAVKGTGVASLYATCAPTVGVAPAAYSSLSLIHSPGRVSPA